MTKRKITQLFTVVALATSAPMMAAANPTQPATEQPRTLPNGAPACGNVQIKGERRTRCTTTIAAAPAPVKPATVARAATQSPAIVQRLLTFFGVAGVARPRQLNNGAPACGNVGSRAVRVCESTPTTSKPSN